jgi:hypothetical protein
MIDNFVFPSDQNRADNDELNRVCEALEVALERIDVQNEKLDSANQQGILDGSAVGVTITPAMIEAGAKRLVRWEDDSTWPDSWRDIDIAAAKQDAERVIRSALDAGRCEFAIFGGEQ